MRIFLTAVFSCGIAISSNAAMAATVEAEKAESIVGVRHSPFDGRERDGGIFFNGNQSMWQVKMREAVVLSKELEREISPLKKLVKLNVQGNSPKEVEATSELSLAAVPVPSSLTLLGVGVLALVGFRRRARARA